MLQLLYNILSVLTSKGTLDLIIGEMREGESILQNIMKYHYKIKFYGNDDGRNDTMSESSKEDKLSFL